MKNKIGLYIHIPFCKSICPYCDFPKMVASKKLSHDFIIAMLEEMKLKKLDNYAFNTLYIGGGTPSNLSFDDLELLLSNLNNYLNLSNLEEFSIEANPDDINQDFIKLIKKYNINRLSIGIQTFNNKFGNLINRKINIDKFDNIIKLLNDYNFNNYSCDLMYGFKNQTIDDIKNDLDILINHNVKHISIYALIIEPHTVFGYKTDHGERFDTSDVIESNMYHFIINYLKNHNYHQYEISNFAKEGYESKHNLIYWNYESYLSLGTSATSIYNKKEEVMTSNIHDYIDKLNNHILPNRNITNLSFNDILEEFVIMNLRKNEGINLDIFKNRYHINFFDVFLNATSLIKDGYLILNNKYLYIPEKYLFVSNTILTKLISNMKV